MSTGLSSLKASEDALNQGNLSTISTATSRTIGCPICSSLVGANIAKNHSLSWNNSEKKCIVCGKNCGKPALLDLFSGAGGAARGYQRAGFCVLGVDIKPQPHYAGCRFVQADAMTYPLDGFDVIHASPPCQGYSCASIVHRMAGKEYPLLIPEVRERLKLSGLPYVIENVERAPLQGIKLCGTMFDLGVFRHRIFESNILLFQPDHPYHSGSIGDGKYFSVAGGAGRWKSWGKVHRDISKGTADQWREAMRIDWMTRNEIKESVPPAYTEFIGKQLMEYLNLNLKEGV